MGVAGCPFDYNCETWHELATDSWVKSLWERIQKFDLSVEIDYKTLEMPREKNECIMERLVLEGFHLATSNVAYRSKENEFSLNGEQIAHISSG